MTSFNGADEGIASSVYFLTAEGEEAISPLLTAQRFFK
jgi:hypothetical protein